MRIMDFGTLLSVPSIDDEKEIRRVTELVAAYGEQLKAVAERMGGYLEIEPGLVFGILMIVLHSVDKTIENHKFQ